MHQGIAEHRNNPRWRVFCQVVVRTVEYGEVQALGINISSGGIFIQTFDPLPLGTEVEIQLGNADGVIARGIVRSHYYMTYREREHPASCTGMGVRFVGFDDVTATGPDTATHLIH